MGDIETTVIERIRSNAPNYTPEWVFNETEPDAGTAFALAFAEQLQETEDLYRQVPDKLYAVFLQTLGVSQRPPQPASGYAALTAVKQADKSRYLPAGEALYQIRNKIPYRTEEDVCITPAVLTRGFYTDEDKIHPINGSEAYVLFEDNAENCQYHACLLHFEWLFTHIGAECRITPACGGLADETNWSYLGDNGAFVPFLISKEKNGSLCFHIDDVGFATTEIDGRKGCFIRVLLTGEEKSDAGRIRFSVYAAAVHAMRMFYNDTEITIDKDAPSTAFHPFGRSFNLHDCFYIASDEAFSKKGATITLTTNVTMATYASNETEERTVVSITCYAIEYWNGKNFVKLLPDRAGFTEGSLQLTFICPADMERLMLQQTDSLWLRLRVLELTKITTPLLSYYAPVFDGINITYDCRDIAPTAIRVSNNGETDWRLGDMAHQRLFEPLLYKNTLFVGFDKAFGGGPIRFLLKTDRSQDNPPMDVALYANGRWEDAVFTDTTRRLGETGVITLTNIPAHQQPCRLFGVELYWVKIAFDKLPNQINLSGVYPNTVRIRQISPLQQAYLTLNPEDLPYTYHVTDQPVIDLSVTINRLPYTGFSIDRQSGILTIPKDALTHIPDRPARLVIIYNTSLGQEGNCDADTDMEMPAAVGFVRRVANPLPITSGRAVEALPQAARRSVRRLRHRGRAVTASDMEALAQEADDGLLRCRCLENNHNGLQAVGYTTLVYLAEDYEKGANPERAERIWRYLTERGAPQLSENERLTVREAVLTPVFAELVVWAKPGVNEAYVTEALEAGYKAFMHPLTGGFKQQGFAIGELPDNADAERFLFTLPVAEMLLDMQLRFAYGATAYASLTLPMPGVCEIIFGSEDAT